LLYILFGPDNFSLQQKLKNLKNEWDEPEALAINTTLFEAQHLTLNQVIETCSTTPFLGQKRLVIVEGLLTRFESKGTKKQSGWDEWKTLTSYVDNMPPTSVLVLTDGKVGGANQLLKSLTRKATVYSFPPLKGPKMQQWIRSRVADQGGSLSPQAAKILTEFGGQDTWALANEIDKLILYVNGQRIEERDVREVSCLTQEANIFALVDAVLERRGRVAVHLLHQLLVEGAAVPYLLFMITRQIRMVLQAKELVTQGTPTSEILSHLGLSPNFPADRLLKQAAGYSHTGLVQVYSKLVETDVAIKTGKQKDELALDILLAELCH